MASESRGQWSTNFGFILAAVGSAIGLGNIWRFSFYCFEHGGGAFLVPYFVALFVVGIPLMLVEYGFGHRERGGSALSFRRMGRGWELGGWWMPTASMFGINLWYAVVIGWCVYYFFLSFNIGWGDDPEKYFLGTYLGFSDVMENTLQSGTGTLKLGALQWQVFLPTLGVWFVSWMICYRDVAHGIERACKIFMPILFLLTIILVVWSVTLPGAKEAIFGHYLHCEWSQINPFQSDPAARAEAFKAWRDAFGQIFFTLSLGFGIMITYASYLPRKSDMVTNALATCLINCIYSFVAGFAVFAVVGFMAQQQGKEFTEAIVGGPPLAFIVYPKAIGMFPALKELFGAMFFLVLVLAGISSFVSLNEAFACSITDKFGWSRKRVVTVGCIFGAFASMIFCTQAGLPALDTVGHFVDYALMIGGILECLVVGWIVKSYVMRKHLLEASGKKIPVMWDVSIRFIIPIFLIFVLIRGVLGEFKENYEGYKTSVLLIFGLGWMLTILFMSIVFSIVPWKRGRLAREHHEGDDDLLT